MTRQTRLGSAIEAVLNVGSGWLIALLLWHFVIGPLWGYEVTLEGSVGLSAVFTIVSVLRTYVWRRLFESRLRRA